MWVPFYILLIFFKFTNNEQTILQVLYQGTLFSTRFASSCSQINTWKYLPLPMKLIFPSELQQPVPQEKPYSQVIKKDNCPQPLDIECSRPSTLQLSWHRTTVRTGLGHKTAGGWNSKFIDSRKQTSNKTIWGKPVRNVLVKQLSTGNSGKISH